jgi:multicomponent Na+:H+ antiporter subunit C
MLIEVQGHFIHWFFVVLLVIGLYGAVAKQNLVKKLIGLSIFQTAIILFYVAIGQKRGATIPILTVGHGPDAQAPVVIAEQFINPLPHVLMLTAIVVGVATMGVAMAIIQRIQAEYGTVEEPEILDKIGAL